MGSDYEQTAVASEIPTRRHVNSLSQSDDSPVPVATQKPPQPLDYLIWSSLLTAFSIFICGFVITIILIAAYKAM
ncbi:unnamed protein product [Adineta ricciae]|uniref:Uncharacterized protein n=1 Tax=Adineta ricciae TaxID=249248 RepID=A0A815MMI0_ADIRI|nr:unnamed protein product [Adineta ricciae]CAF1425290.1 unnamed protein product [Adineta ricciae]